MDKIGWGFFLESRIFFSSKEFSFPSREFLPRVENIFVESRLFSSSPDFFAGSRIFSSSREYPTCHVVICHQNDQTIRRSAICWLRSFFIQRFCSSGCWRTCCGGLGEVSVVYTGLYFPYRTLHNFRKRQKYGIYIHDRLEGFVEIIAAFSLVLANVQSFLEIKVLIDDLSHSLRELLNHAHLG